MEIKVTINGDEIVKNINPNKRLVDFLRDDMNLKSVKEGCSEGECGACTVLLDKKAVTSCTLFAGQIDGCEITTVEGLEKTGELEPIMKSFSKNGAIQCGFCTPGMIMSAKALFYKNSNPSKDEIIKAIEGNLCRCTGYNKIVKAIEEVRDGVEHE
jgi:carbon-monoxide dehydrogenase small subunit